MGVIFVLVVGLVAGIISGIIGTGSSIMLVPVLTYVYGPKEAVPIMAVAALMANVSRILVWFRAVDWRAFAAYAVTGAPSAVLGARTLLFLPSRAVDAAIGVFLLAMIPLRRRLAARDIRISLPQLACIGAVMGFLTGIVVSTGPITVPIFIAYGLTQGAFIGTEAAGSLAVYIAKTLTFGASGALPIDLLLKGVVVGLTLMVGAVIAKPFVLRLRPDWFRLVMDGLMLVSGLTMLAQAFSG